MTINCKAQLKNGNTCRNKKKYGDYCGVHKRREPVTVEDPGLYEPEVDVQKFHTDLPNLKYTIDKYGFAILDNVLDERECEEMLSGMWDFLEGITSNMKVPLSRDSKNTWRTFYDLYPKHGMLLQQWGIGHASILWKLRTKQKIIEPFSRIWGEDPKDLLVSFDGASMSLPPEVTKRGYYRGNNWYHFDQSLSDNSFQCVQSWVTALDVNPGDATLTVLEGSHTQRDIFAQHFGLQNQKIDWYKLTEEQIQWLKDRGCVVRDILCSAGSMVFWDSRTAHAGKEPLKDRESENTRCVGYLCYTPRSKATEGSLIKKRKAFNEKRTTSHWPHKPKVFPLKPRTYGAELPTVVEMDTPTLSDLGKRLAGFD